MESHSNEVKRGWGWKYIPDKYLAIGGFVLLLGCYLFTREPVLEKLMFGFFTLVCTAIGDGLRRVNESRKPQGNATGTGKDAPRPPATES